jgi:hypothetical protein
MKFNSTIKYLITGFCLLLFLNTNAQKNFSVQFSKEGGKYNSPIRLSIESEPGSKIYYTTEGNRPSNRNSSYSSPIVINETTTIRAIAYKNGKASPVATNTYFINESTNYFLIALTVEPAVLTNPQTGWLLKGPNADTIYPYNGANYFSRREVSADLEFFESDGTKVFGDRIGLKLFGGMSRTFDQKSFAVAVREVYGGERRIHHRVFPDKKQKSYKHLVIRNAGSDCEKAHFRDAMITSLLDGIVDIEKQSNRPAILYVNGKYWGIYFIRDKVNRHFVEYSTEVDDDSLDLVEHQERLKAGSMNHYNSMLQYMRNNDLSEVKHYNYIATQMDIDNFMALQITQIYIDNHDAGGNIKFWRPQTPDGKWRWVLYDTDWGFGLQDELAFKSNSLAMHTEANGPTWPNPPWSTFILRHLLKNKNFEKTFINHFSDYINVVFEPNRVIERVDSFKQILVPEYDRHAQKWGYDKRIWIKHIARMKTFARERPAYMRRFLQEKFDIGKANDLSLEVTDGGLVKINQNVEIESKLEGKYFEKIPITLEAIPNYGFQFSHWELPSGQSREVTLTYTVSQAQNKIKAIFKRSNHQLDGQIVINEIAPNNKKSGDWLELYNRSSERVILNKWTIRDANRSFLIKSAVIPPKGYLVLCEDSASFRHFFPDAENVVGNLPFGISKKKELLRLFASNGALIDSVFYQIEPSDSAFVLSLPHPSMDNEDEKNWNIITGYGSPSNLNDGYKETLATIEREKWIKIGGFAFVGLLLLFFGIRFFIKRKN